MQQLALKSLRNQRHLSKYRLAKLSGLSAVYISQLEKGLKSPTERTLKKLAIALGVSVTDLIQDEQAAPK